jgi:hypothetical protein
MQRLALVTALGIASPALAQAPAPLWDFTFGPPAVVARAYGATSDFSGGAYVTGYAGGWTSQGFVNRFAPTGQLLWSTPFGEPMEVPTPLAVCATPDGSIFAAGRVSFQTPPYNMIPFVIRFTSAGDQVWVRQFGTPEGGSATAVCSDGADGVYVAGEIFGSLGAPSAGSKDAFLVRYGPDGDQLWVRQFGTEGVDTALAVVPDGSGGVYVGGWTGGDIGGGHIGESDCWLARYDSSGQRLWIRQFGTPYPDNLNSLASDGQGGFFAAGSTVGDFGGTTAGSWDAFIARLDASGQVIWVRQLGTINNEIGRSVTPDASGGAYLFGSTNGSLAGPQQGAGDLFLARYSSAGEQRWVTQFGTQHADQPRASAPDASGGVFVAGHRPSGPGTTVATLARFPGPCYPNCDNSTVSPTLNIADFTCFLSEFAAGDPYANCDQSTTPPTLNIADFSCFLAKFAAGCH